MQIGTLTWPALLVAIFMLLGANPLSAQRSRSAAAPPPSPAYEQVYKGLEYRSIGPFRGGRSAAVTGVPGKPKLFYFGATGGGVWKTEDGGTTWENISDGYFGGSVGAVAVSEADPNVLYVGGGEKTVRGNVSYGYGMWKSLDAGKTWAFSGLKEARHIPRIRIHPRNPDLVYAAVLGNLFAPSQERGVYRSADGGKTWERILFANADAGAVDLILDPNNPRILYASTWNVRRTPYSLSSGGDGSGLWKSTDGGQTWKDISAAKGMPKGPLGIIGVTVSPLNSNRVWAMVEAPEGGLFRSDDGGQTWAKLNDDRALRQRAWYYTRVYADTKDENTVYVLNVSYHKSTDGGRTFRSYDAPHGDHHDLWIAPEDSHRMVIADDGGAQVSFDGGDTWSTYHNQPTAQFYRLTTDNAFPYRIYVAQQDNSTLRIAHRSTGAYITEADWEETAGGESGHIAVDPLNNDVVYGGSYGGFLTRVDHTRKEERAINVWPDNPIGYGAEGMKYRFQWNFPIFFSPHDPKKLYVTSSHLHVSTNGGHSWQTISPDLTRNDSTKLGPSGGPITKDNTGVEYYCTIFAACESAYEKDLLWVGSDDGLLHVSKDGGQTWENVTPKGMPEWMMFNSIDPDPFQKGGAFVAGTRYKMGDFTPYLYHTADYGKTWKLITNGIDKEHFTRVVRADPKRQGLLYCGTESGMYISFDNGANWKPFQLNLPIVPITDLAIKNDNLIVATQGRSLWLIDDLTPLHQLSAETGQAPFHLFKPMPAYRMEGGQGPPSKTAGQNHPGGVMTYFYLKEAPGPDTRIQLEFMDASGQLIRSFASDAKDKKDLLNTEPFKQGLNRFVWNTRYPDAKGFDGMILWWAGMSGPKAIPGTYKVRLTLNGQQQEQTFDILKSPLSSSSVEEMKQQFTFMMAVRDKVSEAHQAIEDLRLVRKQIEDVMARIKDRPNMEAVIEDGEDIVKRLTAIEEILYQTKNRSNQDPLNFPIRLTNKLAHLNALASMGDFPPTEQDEAFRREATVKIDAELQAFKIILQVEVPAFNALAAKYQVEVVSLPKPKQ